VINFKPAISSLTKPVSLKEHALHAVKEAIITHQLKPNELYSESSLAQKLGVSRTPVREALISLVSQGFVNTVRSRGFRINVWDKKKVQEIFRFRKVLELAAVKFASPRMTADVIAKLKEIHEEELEAQAQGDARAHQLADRDIHMTLTARADNAYLLSSMAGMRDLIEWVGFEIIRQRPDLRHKFSNEHQELIAALEQGDHELAESVMSRHIDRGRVALIKALDPVFAQEG
jgi:DNA-binding GntR family transcriptional regulator